MVRIKDVIYYSGYGSSLVKSSSGITIDLVRFISLWLSVAKVISSNTIIIYIVSGKCLLRNALCGCSRAQNVCSAQDRYRCRRSTQPATNRKSLTYLHLHTKSVLMWIILAHLTISSVGNPRLYPPTRLHHPQAHRESCMSPYV